MKDKLENQLIKRRSDYLNNISKLITLPHLKTRYRIDAKTILEGIQESPEHASRPRACPKCLLECHETQLRLSIKPEINNHFSRKYKNKEKRTKYQLQHAKQLSKLSQQLIIKCSTCQTSVKLPLKRPPKEKEVIEIRSASKQKQKKKKKQKDNLAGINKAAVEQAQKHQEQLAATKDFISLQLTPASTKKRKLDEVIVIEDSPIAPPAKKKKKKKAQANQILAKLTNNSQADIKKMQQQSKDIQDAHNTLAPLTTNKDKKKLRRQLKKIKDSIQNIQLMQNKPKTTIRDFLSTLST